MITVLQIFGINAALAMVLGFLNGLLSNTRRARHILNGIVFGVTVLILVADTLQNQPQDLLTASLIGADIAYVWLISLVAFLFGYIAGTPMAHLVGGKK